MRLWLLTEDTATSQIAAYPKTGGQVLNGTEIFEASMAFNASLPGDGPWPNPWPTDFPTPRVRFTQGRLADYTVTENLHFVSDRMRVAMALPSSAARFLPVENVSRSPRARDARYSLLQLLASARAIDGERSACHVDRPLSAKTGRELLRFSGVTAIRFLPGFAPSSDLFREVAAPTIIFATDTLAERVMAAGCTGVQFRHPLWFAPGFDEVVKSPDGVARIIWDSPGRGYELQPIAIEEADAGPRAGKL